MAVERGVTWIRRRRCDGSRLHFLLTAPFRTAILKPHLDRNDNIKTMATNKPILSTLNCITTKKMAGEIRNRVNIDYITGYITIMVKIILGSRGYYPKSGRRSKRIEERITTLTRRL